MTLSHQVLRNITWECIECNTVLKDDAFKQLPVNKKNVRICPVCHNAIGWGISADPIQQRLTN